MRTPISRGVADQRGYAMVIVMVLLMIALLVGAAGLAETLSSHNLTTHDARERRAQQAADAGIQTRLFDASESNLGSTYNFSGGVLGLGGFLDCTPLQLNAGLQVSGLTAYASTAGVCPQALDSGGSPTSFWSALDHHGYYQSEFFSNKKELGGSGFGSVVEFPQIVYIGCDTTSPATCRDTPAPTSNAYSRELALLAPAGPLQAIEGMGNVTINGLKVLGINTAAVVNGDVMAGGTLSIPAVGIAVNSNWPATGVLPTFGYVNTPAPSSISTANIVHLSGYCSAGNPSTSCMIKRVAPTAAATSCAACTTGITCSSCSGGGYNASSDTFTLTGGTATFAGGDYLFCNFNASGGGVNASPMSTAPVRIFIRSPRACGGTGGSFAAANGINNSLTGVVNGVTGTIDPSGVQIYVQGDGSYDNATSVSIGTSSNSNALTAAMIIYAPTSTVTVNTGKCTALLGGVCTLLGLGLGGTFSGNIVGDNTSITAGVITQDLGIGNYPLYNGSNAFRPVQYVQCSTSVTTLTGSSSDTSGC